MANQELLEENSVLRQRIGDLEKTATDIRQAKALLRECQEMHAMVVDAMPDVLVRMNLDGEIVFINSAALRLGNYQMSEIIGRNMLSLVAPEDRERVVRNTALMFEGKLGPQEYLLLTKDGSKVPFEANGDLLRDENGNPYGIFQICREITQRKHMEKELAIITEIGRLIGSTLDIDEVYERFAAEVRKLIPFDRIHINLMNPDGISHTIAYVSGFAIEKRRVGDKVVIAGTVTEALIRTKRGVFINPASEEELADSFGFPSAVVALRAGTKSFMAVPLIHRDEVIGALQILSKEPNTYTEKDLRVAERIVQQISGAVANSRMFRSLARTEKELRISLLEKETMLKEIHHRVKNNLQVISSLLGLQSTYLQDETAREALQQSISRVRTMAMIHSNLYQSESLSRVDFGSFIRDLIGNIGQSYRGNKSPVDIDVAVGDLALDIEASVPCGLILNELMTNAMKHAFPEGRGGRIDIRMRTDEGLVVLEVCDNGIGFPESSLTVIPKTLGLKLVNILAGQIKGHVDMSVDCGTRWTLTFPLKRERDWTESNLVHHYNAGGMTGNST